MGMCVLQTAIYHNATEQTTQKYRFRVATNSRLCPWSIGIRLTTQQYTAQRSAAYADCGFRWNFRLSSKKRTQTHIFAPKPIISFQSIATVALVVVVILYRFAVVVVVVVCTISFSILIRDECVIEWEMSDIDVEQKQNEEKNIISSDANIEQRARVYTVHTSWWQDKDSLFVFFFSVFLLLFFVFVRTRFARF